MIHNACQLTSGVGNEWVALLKWLWQNLTRRLAADVDGLPRGFEELRRGCIAAPGTSWSASTRAGGLTLNVYKDLTTKSGRAGASFRRNRYARHYARHEYSLLLP